MNKFFALFIAFCTTLGYTTLRGATFAELDATISSAAKMRIDASEELAQWRAEKSETEAALKALDARSKICESEISAAKAELSARESQTRIIADKIGRDEAALAQMSRYFDSVYTQILKNNSAKSVLEKCGLADGKSFAGKTAPEKFRTLCEIFKILKNEDFSLRRDARTVSAGAILRASGTVGDDGIAVLKVQRRESAK